MVFSFFFTDPNAIVIFSNIMNKTSTFDGFLFFTGPNPIIVYIVIFSKIIIKIVKVGNRIMFLKERKLTYFDETTSF